jgi:hypothetical protein
MERLTTHTVTFGHPFDLAGEHLPAGAYTVEAREESIEELSFPAWRRIGLQLRIARGAGSYEMLDIRQEDLDRAQAKDIA